MNLFSAFSEPTWWLSYKRSLQELYGGGCPPKTYGMANTGQAEKEEKEAKRE